MQAKRIVAKQRPTTPSGSIPGLDPKFLTKFSCSYLMLYYKTEYRNYDGAFVVFPS